jgi:hypothetical protein
VTERGRDDRPSTEGNRGGGGRATTWYGQNASFPARQESANLADILERVLDKGIVIAGDIQVNLLDIELLTIKLRLVVASVERAREMGIDWWEYDPSLSSGQRRLKEENRRLRDQVRELETRQGALEADAEVAEDEAQNDTRAEERDRD